MDREFDQFLKELRPAAAHIPDAPNQTVLPCSGPRLYVGVFFDGTGNERQFDEKQHIADYAWLTERKEGQRLQALDRLEQCRRAETEAASAVQRARAQVRELQAEAGRLRAQADLAMVEWQTHARDIAQARARAGTGGATMARLRKVEDQARQRCHRLNMAVRNMDAQAGSAENRAREARGELLRREQATARARRDCSPASPGISGLTNVAKLYDLYQTSTEEEAKRGIIKRSIYIRGVGTKEGKGVTAGGAAICGLAFAAICEGAKHRTLEARKEIAEILDDIFSAWASPPSSVTIDLFGFSRGAGLARHFVNVILAGLPDISQKPVPVTGAPLPFGDMLTLSVEDHEKHGAQELINESLRYPALPNVNIRFVGLFDTVGSFYLPGNDREGYYDLGLPPGCARHIVHLVAAQEWREYFPLTRIRPGDGEEIAMAGAHADIGGGYPMLEKSTLLMDEEPYATVCQRDLGLHGIWVAAQEEHLRARETILKRVRERGLLDENGDLPAGWFLLPTPTNGDVHHNVTLSVRLMRDKLTHHGYANVPLHIMHRKALAAGVPFNDLDNDDPLHAVPRDLAHLVDKPVQDLPPGLWEKYAHVSAAADTLEERLTRRPRVRYPSAFGMQLDPSGSRETYSNPVARRTVAGLPEPGPENRDDRAGQSISPAENQAV